MRKAHFVLQGKGGVGKTFVASLIAQYLTERGEPVACLDTDQVNGSFQDITALGARPVKILKEDSEEIDIAEMDGMVEHILTEDSHFVVDNGATSFVPMSRYLVQDGVVEAICGAGKQVVVHTIGRRPGARAYRARLSRRGPAIPAGSRDRAVAQRASRRGARRRRQGI